MVIAAIDCLGNGNNVKLVLLNLEFYTFLNKKLNNICLSVKILKYTKGNYKLTIIMVLEYKWIIENYFSMHKIVLNSSNFFMP